MVRRHLEGRSLTRYYTSPPDWILEVRIIVTRARIHGISLSSIVQSLVSVRRRTWGRLQSNDCTFFVMMKLVPMATELDTARARPIYLSSTISLDFHAIPVRLTDRCFWSNRGREGLRCGSRLLAGAGAVSPLSRRPTPRLLHLRVPPQPHLEPTMSVATQSQPGAPAGIKSYYQAKIETAEIEINQKTQNLRRLEAQRNALNARGA